MADRPIGERVAALEALLPGIQEDLREIKRDVKAIRNGKALRTTVLEAVRLLGALVAGLFGGQMGGKP